MRIIGAVTGVVLLLEALLGGLFWLGYWWGGWWLPGAGLALAALLLLAAPWLGELRVEYDSRPLRLAVRAGWVFSLLTRAEPERETRWRVLCIPWRSRPSAEAAPAPKAKPAPRQPPPRRRSRAETLRKLAANPEEISRLALAGLGVVHELLWEARELSLRVYGPSGVALADQALAGVVGSRRIGRLDLALRAAGPRRVQLTYRIGLARAGLGLALAVLQARPGSLWRLRGSGRKPKAGRQPSASGPTEEQSESQEAQSP